LLLLDGSHPFTRTEEEAYAFEVAAYLLDYIIKEGSLNKQGWEALQRTFLPVGE
jgi:hypothetical protein